ncbi:MAG: pyridoxamine 5'-phosphate oxidase family protein [Acidimicrobiales bacterium]
MDSLETTAPAFVEMAHRIVWCTVATLDGRGEPRTRILHPIWEWDGESLVGWIATGKTPVKLAGLAASPHVSLTYWDSTQDTCTADCGAEWIADDEREALWRRFAEGPAPVGYDPAIVPVGRWPAVAGVRGSPAHAAPASRDAGAGHARRGGDPDLAGVTGVGQTWSARTRVS